MSGDEDRLLSAIRRAVSVLRRQYETNVGTTYYSANAIALADAIDILETALRERINVG